MAFVSHANNLVTNDDRGPHLDLFVRDLVSSNTLLVSLGMNGVGGGNESVGLYSLSSNAHVIAFDTVASNLAPGDTNRTSDIYARDVATGITTLVSKNAFRTGSANGASFNPLISEDGRYVIFESLASNLVTNDFNGTNDIFIHDLATGLTSLVSVNSDGTASPDGPSDSPSISADGLRIAFVSRATNLIAGVTNQLGEVYLRDVLGGSNVWAMASHVPSLLPPGSGKPYFASEPILSADGRYVAFKTSGRTVRFDLQRPTNSIHRTFAVSGNRMDLEDNPRVSATSDTAPLALTADGRFAVYVTATNVIPPLSLLRVDFESWATNVIPETSGCCYATNIGPEVMFLLTNGNSSSGPKWTRMSWIQINSDASRCFFLAAEATNLTSQLYRLNVTNGLVQLLSTNRNGTAGPDLRNVVPVVSPDGTQIAWDSPDEDIVTDDLNRAWDVFVRDVESGEPQAISLRRGELTPVSGTGMSRLDLRRSAISANGRRLAILSLDSTIAPHDTNEWLDLFVRDVSTGSSFDVSRLSPYITPSQVDNNTTAAPVLSADGRYLAFAGEWIGTTVTNRTVYWRDLQSSSNVVVVTGESDRFALGNLPSQPALSPDGRLVAFDSPAASGPDLNGRPDIMVALMIPGIPPPTNSSGLPCPSLGGPIISLVPSGLSTANAASVNPSFSPDSSWILFQSLATNLTETPLDTRGQFQLFGRGISVVVRYDCDPVRESIKHLPTRLISYITSASSEPSGRSVEAALPGGGANPRFSANARYVAFESTPNLIYRHDLLGELVATITEQAGVLHTNIARLTNDLVCNSCINPTLNADGRFIAYETRRVGGVATDVFVKDLQTGEEQLISVNLAGSGGGNRSSSTPLISYDARFVVFASKASDLVPNDNNGAADIFVRDRIAGVTHCLSRNWSGAGTGNRGSSNPAMSADGRTVAFQSFADDLAPGDYNETRDVFVVTMGGPDTDGDGMDDDWEMAYFSTLSRDGSGDFEGDGASDRSEFQAGTNPANDGSVLRVLTLVHSVESTGGALSRVTLLWSASPGKTYRVQFKDNVDEPWQDLGANITAAGSAGSYVDTIENALMPGLNRKFYRVVLIQ